MELSRFRLIDLSDIPVLELKYGEEMVSGLKNKMFAALEKLPVGRHFDISHGRHGSDRPENELEILVKVCCLWIRDHRNYEMSNDYTKIRKIHE